ncbi:MAG: hypothetical protein N4A65_15490 [Cohaesibacter sp.]|jgi:hypothetical protein|nr:hypothetical protein [Cohaesibacter sp.]
MSNRGYFGIVRVDCEGGGADALVHAQPELVDWDDMIELANQFDQGFDKSSPYRHFPTRISKEEYKALFGRDMPDTFWKKLLQRLQSSAFAKKLKSRKN